MMLNESRRVLSWALPLCFAASLLARVAEGQAQVETPLDRQLHRLDLGVSVIEVISGNTSGQSYANTTPAPSQAQTLNTDATNGTGGLVQLRYTKSPLLGAELNYSFARYTTNFNPLPAANGSVCSVTNPPPCVVVQGGVQANANEATLGYVAHGPVLTSFGLKPFIAAGAGSTVFTPTLNGGSQGLYKQARLTYYYAAGVEAPLLTSHFGLRAQFRQSFYLLPDFTANFLTIKQRTNSIEPSFGFYLHY